MMIHFRNDVRLLREEVVERSDRGLQRPRAARRQRVRAPSPHLRHHTSTNHRRCKCFPNDY